MNHDLQKAFYNLWKVVGHEFITTCKNQQSVRRETHDDPLLGISEKYLKLQLNKKIRFTFI